MVYGGVGWKLSQFELVKDNLALIDGLIGIGRAEFQNSSDMMQLRTQLNNTYYWNYPRFMGISIYHFALVYADCVSGVIACVAPVLPPPVSPPVDPPIVNNMAHHQAHVCFHHWLLLLIMFFLTQSLQ